MRTRAVIPALVLAGALVATVGASARPQATNIQIRTVLSAAQEVPSPTGASIPGPSGHPARSYLPCVVPARARPAALAL
jgi:hypothetical protein